MSIFDTSPPLINKDILFKWIYKNYDFLDSNIINSIKLNSERDYNLKITTNNNKNFVIKISNPYENINTLTLQDSMLEYLSNSSVSKYIPIISHKDIKKFTDLKNRECFVRILSFLKGDIFAHHQGNDQLCKNLSIFLGNLSKSLLNFDHSAAHRKFIWNSINIEWIEEDLEIFPEKIKRNLIKKVIKSYLKYVKPKLSNIRYSVIHGDANNYNILCSKNKIVGLLDYGDSIYAPTICELTVALAYALMNTDDIIQKCNYMVKSYHSIFQLNKDEIELIMILIMTRLSITVTMASKQKLKYPDNEYLSISENDAWDLLFKFDNIIYSDFTNNLLNVCNYEK
ncbi:MAG: hypothetical protein CFH21_00880 [Alphaproteobacteria bacterium MarineAlpha5_Bin11]|nr:hypothetical protein [Pelagibacteraceae bacterium]PPR43175.1 MAG: hypothetical protein CFH21_00880 [Alphaproteobacteria bacterium MarineAlpha5_Bin11]PPR51122.1 MAG: hypothetical protein CFH20_00808 [Alphaproteobacteria bacterium MarineAlpha5_Bin10]|tara:strand:+ start:1222 stop:2244 length:1023 start_codon:yes stop_codon:yes gene_type:complete